MPTSEVTYLENFVRGTDFGVNYRIGDKVDYYRIGGKYDDARWMGLCFVTCVKYMEQGEITIDFMSRPTVAMVRGIRRHARIFAATR